MLLFLPMIVMAGAVEDLNSKLAGITSITANFKQQVLSEDGTPLQTSKGSMAILRPGKFRWTTTSPLNQIIITNGTKLWIYEPDLEQVTIQNLTNNIGQTPLLLLTNKDIVLQNNFLVEQISTTQVGEWFKLLPKANNSSFKQITIGFVQNKITYLKLLNQLGQTTEIFFSQVKINSPLSANLFSFKIPSNVDVINMSGSQGE
ncbi:MAG: outer membrane lipoprotein carrier protein LolA [Gammaproteobacteria bacterium RIFCSPHIGHO2_12_FULL_35_23]|nr:MAG: outer membrane lipoprotein carrier protein LolA [Gammaproteobacteria bacterium RIFCSPHIGHO2_12_FULL_35_23]